MMLMMMTKASVAAGHFKSNALFLERSKKLLLISCIGHRFTIGGTKGRNLHDA